MPSFQARLGILPPANLHVYINHTVYKVSYSHFGLLGKPGMDWPISPLLLNSQKMRLKPQVLGDWTDTS